MEEIRREALAHGMTVADDATGTRVALTVGAEGHAAAQSYSIRVQNEGGRRTLTVTGADAAGAMYGGLDIAEALRTGTLDALKDSDHAPHSARRGITGDLSKESTKKYFRASVRELVKTCPLLAGMGITAGEGMPHKMDSRAKEAWLWDTYGEGVRDALKDEPRRAFDMTGDKAAHGKSLRHLVAALDHWKRYAALRDAQYVPALYSRVGYVGVTELTEKVAADLEIARNWKPGTLQDDNKRSDTEKGFRK